MLHVETEKLAICLRKQSWDFVGRLTAALLDCFRWTVHMTLSKTKCLGKTVRTWHPYSIKPENSFSTSKNCWLWDFLSQNCLKYPDWIFPPFLCSNTLWRLVSPQHPKHHMPRGIILTYGVKTCHLVWLLRVQARILRLLYGGCPSRVAFWIESWAWEHLLPKNKWDCYAWSRQHCISFSLHFDAAFSVLGVEYIFVLLKGAI